MLESSERDRCAVLWVAPNPNFYKLRFLARLQARRKLEITAFCGRSQPSQGHPPVDRGSPFERIEFPVAKSRFAFHPRVLWAFYRQVRTGRFDVVLLPIEKKAMLLILVAAILRWRFHYVLVSYNHPSLRSGRGIVTVFDRLLSQFLYAVYDRVIFYTEHAYHSALDSSLIGKQSASFANNTVDTEAIWARWKFSCNSTSSPKTLLFIGRLVRYKRLDLLFEYFEAMRSRLCLNLTIIGDGPLAGLVQENCKNDAGVTWLGALSDEEQIGKAMDASHAVFVPGASGLSIVHSFCYGKPYICCVTDEIHHGPEISYLEDGENGLLLSGSTQENLDRVVEMLSDSSLYQRYCRNAYLTATRLDVRNWCNAVETAILETVGGSARCHYS